MGGPGSGGSNPPTEKSKSNLQVFGKIDPELHRQRASNGGKAAQRVLAKKRTFRQAAEWIMSMPAFASQNEAVEAIRQQYPDLDNSEAMTIALVSKAIEEGDTKAYTTIRDTSGETPTVDLSAKEPMVITIKTVD